MRATQSRAAQQRSEPSPHTEQGRKHVDEKTATPSGPYTRHIYYSSIYYLFLFVICNGLMNDKQAIFIHD